MKNIINIENVSFSYGNFNVLNDINLKISKSEIVGIIGSNGAGKTTLIKLLIGSLSPDKGNIEIYGSNVKKICKSHTIGYVSQSQDKNKMVFPATVFEIVMMNLYMDIGLLRFPNKTHKQKVMEALKLVGMEEYKDKMIHNLSGGQRQRVMIAKSIVSMPNILILDEPTTGVDEASSKMIYELLQTLNKKLNLTIIMISHDIKNLRKYSTNMYEIEYGRLNKV
ncbi:ABC transporter, ATP-binding protein [[Eubacterium] yurii subsp. margaretiae ATCC 43715]|nr:ABC transporter, ATP-binding protein [[Eubacterium] yurii subsp. margaretiae ATCC 43715]